MSSCSDPLRQRLRLGVLRPVLQSLPPKPARNDFAHAYRPEAEACARHHYTYTMDTVKDG